MIKGQGLWKQGNPRAADSAGAGVNATRPPGRSLPAPLHRLVRRHARHTRRMLDGLERHWCRIRDELQQVEAARRRWTAIFDGLREPVFVLDADLRIVRANLAYARLAGRPVKALIGRHYWEVFPRRNGPLPGDARSLAGEGEIAGGDEVGTEDGRVFLARAFPLTEPEGERLLTVHILEDITDQRAAERALREREEMFHAITTASLDAIVLIDNEERVVHWNPAAERIFGYPAQEAAGRKLHDLVAPERHREKAAAGFAAFRDSGRGPLVGKTLEIEARRRDGSEFPVELSIAALKLKDRWHSVGIVRDITARRRAREQAEAARRALGSLSAVNRAVVHARRPDRLLQQVCDAVSAEGGYPLVWVGRFEDRDGGRLVPRARAGPAGDGMAPLRPDGRSPEMEAVRTGRPVVVDDLAAAEGFDPGWRERTLAQGLGSCIALPLRGDDVVTGCLAIYAARPGAFGAAATRALLADLAEDLAFGLRTLGERLKRASLERRHQGLLVATIGALSTAVEKRDPYTAGHQRRVAELAVAIARKLGLQEDRVDGIRLGGLVHDVGKIYIPAEILNRPGRLTEAEFALIRSHPEVGAEIVRGIDFPWPVRDMILQHHERLDGSGYPGGLRGGAICREARILAVADVVEAMSTHRPYRPALGLGTALQEIEAGRGARYDPDAVDACLTLFRREGFNWQDPDGGTPNGWPAGKE